MKRVLTFDMGGHIVALTGMVGLHAGMAAWAMAPQPPVVIPEQQIIQISMVPPTVIQKEKQIQPARKIVKKVPNIAPRKTGMVKLKPKPKVRPVQKVERMKDVPPMRKQVVQKSQLTSGLQSKDALAKKAAFTEPVAAAYLRNPPPEYPSRARRHKQQGTVMLKVRVNAYGKPQYVAVSSSSGHRLLDMAALEAVKRWAFVPARRGSRHVEASVVIPVEFRIN